MDDAEKSRDQLVAELRELRSQIKHLDTKIKNSPDSGEERFVLDMDDLDDAIQIIDLDWRLVYLNEAAARQGRQPKEAMLNKTLFEAFPGFENSLAYPFLERCMEEGFANHMQGEFEYPDGEKRRFEVYAKPIKGGIFVFSSDITGQQEKRNLSEVERRYFTFLENLPGIAFRCRNEKDWPMEYISQGCYAITGYQPEELRVGGTMTFGDLIHPDDRQMVWREVQAGIEGHRPYRIEYRIITKSGETRWVWEQGGSVGGINNSPIYLEGFIADITERKQQQEKLRLSEQTLQIFFDNIPMLVAMFDKNMCYVAVSNSWAQIQGKTRTELLGLCHYDAIPDMDDHFKVAHRKGLNGEIVRSDLEPVPQPDGTKQWFRWEVRPWYQPDGDIGGIVIFSEYITDRVKALDALEESENRFRTLVEQLPAITYEAIPGGNFQTTYISPQIEDYLGFSPKEYIEDADLWYKQVHPDDRERVVREIEEGLDERGSFVSDYRMFKRDGEIVWFRDSGHLIRDHEGKVLSLQGVMNNITETKLADIKIQAYVRRIESLLEIEKAMSSTLEFDNVIEIIMDELKKVIPYDAIGLHLLEQNHLNVIAARGFNKAESIIGNSIPLDVVLPFHKVISTMTPFPVVDIEQEYPEINERMSRALGRKIRSWLGVPLINEGAIVGMLTFDRVNVIPFTDDEIQMAMTVASHAAMAINNAKLMEGLQESREKLEFAYDATIEGWSIAMDLRDKETEGHTLRVTEATILLAKNYGLSEEALMHLRRGALLHDIGKIGVPDDILYKPEPLTEEEWQIMRRHPQHAYDMLSQIEYLKPALEVPYCHHEKWDGSGYPQGLRGEEIPIAARIFAVADVWDALRSDRPYRKAWDEQKALDYIIQNSGTHFDPKIVSIFAGMMEKPSKNTQKLK